MRSYRAPRVMRWSVNWEAAGDSAFLPPRSCRRVQTRPRAAVAPDQGPQRQPEAGRPLQQSLMTSLHDTALGEESPSQLGAAPGSFCRLYNRGAGSDVTLSRCHAG